METTWDNKELEIINFTNRAISELVYDKVQLQKAYNYYHGKRDPEQFRHLEENYGIGTATSVEFVPLIRKHIDVLIGEYLSAPLLPKISCKDKATLSNIHRNKQLEINNTIVQALKAHLNNSIYSAVYGDASKQPRTDKEVEEAILEAQSGIERNFISDYEIAGQNLVDWAIQSRNIDFANQRKLLLTDLLTTGTCYYKVCKSASKDNISLKVLNPIHTFIDRNIESAYLKDSMRSVIREYLTKDQILAKYGEDLSPDDLLELDRTEQFSMDGATTTYLRSYETTVTNTVSDGILGGFEVSPMLPFDRGTSFHYRMYPVYEVEWLKTEKENDTFIMNRYRSVRIGANIFIPYGKEEDVPRSADDPKKCSLSVNGMFYADRNGDPYSLVLKTMNLQDKFDVLHFYRDNIIAESGTAGDWIDIAYLPAILGTSLSEKLLKWKAYKKQGMALIDSSQEGLPPMNTTFGGFDDTIKAQTIQAIQLAIQDVEDNCSTITGVFKERLGGIEQKDAVTNVQIGVRQSSYITKQYYQVMDLMTREILLDIINLAKLIYRTGFAGTLILGERLNKVFTALPEHYTATDFDIHITDSSEIIKEQETIKQVTMEFIKGGNVDPEIILETVTATGLTRMKEDVYAAISKRRKEMNEVGQLSQQVEQLDNQLKQAQTEAQKLQQQVNQLNEAKLKLEQEKLAFQKEIEWFTAKSKDKYDSSMVELEQQRVKLEGLQLLDNNLNNDEIKNN